MCGLRVSFEGFFLDPRGVKGLIWDVYMYLFVEISQGFPELFWNYFGFWNVFLGQKLVLVVDRLMTLFEVSLDQPFGVL